MKKNYLKKQNRKNLVDSLHRKMEKIIIKSIFLANIGLIINKRSTLKEFKNLSSDKIYNFISIGCGSFPWSLIILSKEKNWNFTGIDHDKEAVIYSKKIIRKYNISKKVKIYYDDALNHDFSSYDIILFSFGVEPRKEIFEQIIKTIKKNGIIVFRTTWETLNSIYNQEIIPKELNIKNVYYRYDGIKSITLKLSNKSNQY